MLKVRENARSPAPEPLSPAAISALFQRIRTELRLPAAPQRDRDQPSILAARRLDRRTSLQAAGFPFASDADYQAI
jgi:hypothetical protein